jgi:hypothetical protein
MPVKEELDRSFRFPTGADLGKRIHARLNELPRKRPDLHYLATDSVDMRPLPAPTPTIMTSHSFLLLLGGLKKEAENGSDHQAIRIASQMVEGLPPETMVTRRGLQTLLHDLAMKGLGRCATFRKLEALSRMNRLGL